MPSEPDNRIGDLLKTYAKKRRDEAGAPLELHPATRKLLQGEVAKLRPDSSTRPQNRFNWWLACWPQLSAAASILVVLAVGYRILLQEQEAPVTAEQFAKRQAPAAEAESLDRLNRSMPADDSPAKAEGSQDKSGAFRTLNDAESKLSLSEARESKDAAAKGGEATIRQLAKAKEDSSKATGGRAELNQSTALGADKKSVLLTRNEPVVERDALLKQLAPTAPAAPQPSQPRDLSVASGPRRMKAVDSDAQPLPVARTQTGTAAVTLSDELTTGAPAVAGASGPPQTPPQEKAFYRLAGTTDGRQFSVAQRQRFIQAPQPTSGLKNRNSAREGAVQGVLASFEMQQDGARLRAIDADGSIYEGQFDDAILVTNAKPATLAAPALQPSPTPASRPAVGRTSSTSGVDTAKPGQPSRLRFRLSGTNQTLKQLVIFEGLLSGSAPAPAPTSLAGATVSSTDIQSGKPPPDAYSLQQGTLLSSPIQGTLRIGGSNALPVQALPVNR